MVIIAGQGPPPKDPAKRARSNSDPMGRKTYVRQAARVEQPSLPTVYEIDENGDRKRVGWCTQTQRWWKMWAAEPLAVDFTASDWDHLVDTARLHNAFWRTSDARLMKNLAAEIRVRTAKLGATIEDRLRLRIDYVPAAPADGDNPTGSGGGARARRGPLTVAG